MTGAGTRGRAARSSLVAVVVAALALTSAAASGVSAQEAQEPPVIPRPVSLEMLPGEGFALERTTRIVVDVAAGDDVVAVARHLHDLLRPATGFALPVTRRNLDWEAQRGRPATRHGQIVFALGGPQGLGPEAYTLDSAAREVRIEAATAEGLFRGLQTLRQLLPPEIESATRRAGPWTVPAVSILDHPRYEWRGAHLDVARHFLTVDEVKRYIDLLAQYKFNRFHMHLSDDQGWRIEITSWPNLTAIGGSTEVGGGPGGFYTQADYVELVEYAAERYITLVPEIDVPGHTNAAEVSYPELNSCREGNLPSHRLFAGPEWADEPFYTGIAVGFSSLCVHDPVTYEFMSDVIGEISALTPGPYFHIGGDEAHQTPRADYIVFMDRMRDLIAANGKTMMGWAELAQSNAPPGSIAQHWSTATGGQSGGNLARTAVAKGMDVVMSPANRVYVDMKYAPGVPPDLGLTWAGTVSVMRSYTWDPGAHINGVTDENVIGVEAPLWSETIENIDDAETMGYPRLAGVGEIGWTPQADRDWDEYRLRLAAQGPRWDIMGVDYYRSPDVPWQGGGG